MVIIEGGMKIVLLLGYRNIIVFFGWVSKVGDLSRGWPEGSFSLDCSALLLILSL